MSISEMRLRSPYKAIEEANDDWGHKSRGRSGPPLILVIDASDEQGEHSADVLYRAGRHLAYVHGARMDTVLLHSLDGDRLSALTHRRLMNADAVIWTSSSRGFGAATRIQSFISQASTYRDGRSGLLAGRVAGAIVTENDQASEAVLDRLLKAAIMHDMEIAGWAVSDTGPDSMSSITSMLDILMKRVQSTE